MKAYLKTIRAILRQYPYNITAVLAAMVFAFVNVWLLLRVTSFSSFIDMARNGDFFVNLELAAAKVVSLAYLVLYALETLAMIAFFGISAALFLWIYTHKQKACSRSMVSGGGGVLSALFASACPTCGAYLLALLGVGSGVSLLPLKGLELKTVSLGLLIGSVLWSAKKVSDNGLAGTSIDGQQENLTDIEESARNNSSRTASSAMSVNVLYRPVIWILVVLLAANQLLIGNITKPTSASSNNILKSLASVFSPAGASAREIYATKLNPDGRTTTIAKWPTITEVSAEPRGMDTVEAAKVVMIGQGAPFYAPQGISFDDPVGALAAWQNYEKAIQLPSDLQARWNKIVSTMTCDYCCGSPTRVTVINRCGCRHAQAYRSIAKYLLQNYGDKYSDDEIIGELQRWKGVWYPKGVVEDYLLATGRGDVLGHANHGGAGSAGRHGF